MDPDSFVCQWADAFNQISLTVPDMGAWTALVLGIFLLFVSGFVSASEIAFFSLTSADHLKIEQGEKKADREIRRLLNDSERLMATILIANIFVNITIVVLCDYFFAQLINWGILEGLRLVFVVVVLAFLLLLFGEITPKVYSVQQPLSFCRRAVRGISFFSKLFYPLSSILKRSSWIVGKLLTKENYNISVDDLSQALELTNKDEILDEQNILKGIIRFGGETAKDVMTSRVDIVDLEISTPFREVMHSIIENVYSRIPVYQENRDNIKGILYIKDLLPYLDKGDNFKWQSLIRPAYFVPETKMIDALLRDFQKNKIHIAIVVDEFGGTSGLVTMEDIIEEIVGEINDEYDEDERNYVKLNDKEYIFEAKTLLTDFYRVLKIDEDLFESVEGEADTLAGLLLELKGEFPQLHEKILYGNYEFEVLKMDNRRILKVKVTVLSDNPITTD